MGKGPFVLDHATRLLGRGRKRSAEREGELAARIGLSQELVKAGVDRIPAVEIECQVTDRVVQRLAERAPKTGLSE